MGESATVAVDNGQAHPSRGLTPRRRQSGTHPQADTRPLAEVPSRAESTERTIERSSALGHRDDLPSQILPRPAVLSSPPAGGEVHPGGEVSPSMTSAAPTEPTPYDARQWADVYRNHADFVWRSLRRMGLSSEDAEDALHEVFLVWYRRRESFDSSRGTLKSWLFGIAANVVRSEQRKKRRASPHPDSQECFASDGSQRPIVSESSWRATDGVAKLAGGELKRAIAEAVSELPPEHRAVFVMFEVEGVDCTTIASELGVPVGTVYSRLHTARGHLKEALQAYRQARAPESKGGVR